METQLNINPEGITTRLIIDGRERIIEEVKNGFYIIGMNAKKHDQRESFHSFNNWQEVRENLKQGKSARVNGSIYQWPVEKQEGPQLYLYNHGETEAETFVNGSDSTGYTCTYTGRDVDELAQANGKKKGEYSILDYESMTVHIESALSNKYEKWEEVNKDRFEDIRDCMPPYRWRTDIIMLGEAHEFNTRVTIIKYGTRYFEGIKPELSEVADLRKEVQKQFKL